MSLFYIILNTPAEKISENLDNLHFNIKSSRMELLKEERMKITLNGQSKDISSATIADIVGQYCANRKNIITEVNGAIIPSASWASTSIKEGDTIELVAFVGGG